MLKSDIGTCTFNLIKIGSCNNKSSIVLVNDGKVLYEEIMTNDDNLESNLLTTSLLKICSLYKFCYKLSWRSVLN